VTRLQIQTHRLGVASFVWPFRSRSSLVSLTTFHLISGASAFLRPMMGQVLECNAIAATTTNKVRRPTTQISSKILASIAADSLSLNSIHVTAFFRHCRASPSFFVPSSWIYTFVLLSSPHPSSLTLVVKDKSSRHAPFVRRRSCCRPCWPTRRSDGVFRQHDLGTCHCWLNVAHHLV
jgi:hypothetical protein